jgi:hypothetical protein
MEQNEWVLSHSLALHIYFLYSRCCGCGDVDPTPLMPSTGRTCSSCWEAAGVMRRADCLS